MDPKLSRRTLEEQKKCAQRDFKDDMQKNTYFRDANDPQTWSSMETTESTSGDKLEPDTSKFILS